MWGEVLVGVVPFNALIVIVEDAPDPPVATTGTSINLETKRSTASSAMNRLFAFIRLAPSITWLFTGLSWVVNSYCWAMVLCGCLRIGRFLRTLIA